MTLINRWFAAVMSDAPPAELLLPANRVRQVAEHSRITQYTRHPDGRRITVDELSAMILRSEMCFCGVPVRVVGAAAVNTCRESR